VRPALRNEGGKRRAALRLDQRVLVPRFGRIDVEWRRRDVVIAGEHDRQILLQERRGMFAQPRKPVELVIEFGPRLWIAVRQVKAGDDDAADGGLEVT